MNKNMLNFLYKMLMASIKDTIELRYCPII